VDWLLTPNGDWYLLPPIPRPGNRQHRRVWSGGRTSSHWLELHVLRLSDYSLQRTSSVCRRELQDGVQLTSQKAV